MPTILENDKWLYFTTDKRGYMIAKPGVPLFYFVQVGQPSNSPWGRPRQEPAYRKKFGDPRQDPDALALQLADNKRIKPGRLQAAGVVIPTPPSVVVLPQPIDPPPPPPVDPPPPIEPPVDPPPPIEPPPPPPPVVPFGAPTDLSLTGLGTGNLASWTAVTDATSYEVWRQSKTDREDPQNQGNPWSWVLMTPLPITGTVFFDEFARELEEYTYAIWALKANDDRSETSKQGTLTTAVQAPQNHLCHWSEDLSKTGWQGWYAAGGAVAITGVAGSQQMAFSGASQSVNQRVACYPLTGRTYSYLWTVKGTAGQTIKFHAHDDELGSTFDHTYTLGSNPADADGWEDVTFTRAFTTTGRRMRVGINTYGVTARSVQVKRVRVAAGGLTRTELITGYQKTSGPGSTWCEPLQIDTVHAAGQPITVSSWHKSMRGDIQTARVRVDTPVTFDGFRSISRSHHITGSAGNFQIDNLNSRYYSLNPRMAGRHFGRVMLGDYGLRYVQDRCYCERTSGVRVGLFRGRSAQHTFKVTRTLYQDIDGRYVNADGSYVRSSYGSSHGTRPGNAPLGFETAQAAYLYSLYDPRDKALAPTPPYTVPGIEVAWNDVRNRPGFSRHEDLINFHGVQADPGSPAQIHHNRLGCVGPYDYLWHELNDFTRPYNYGNILTTFTLNGVTVNQGPGNSSGTAILPSDLFSFDADALVRNTNNIELHHNFIYGMQGIITVQAGRNQWSRDDTIISSGNMPRTMSGVVIPATQHRRSGFQYTHYAIQKGNSGRAFDHTTLSSFAKDGTNGATNATSSTVTALPVALPAGYEVRFANNAWAILTAPAAAGAKIIQHTPMQAPTANAGSQVPAGTAARAGASELVWMNNGIQRATQAVAGLTGIGFGDGQNGGGHTLNPSPTVAEEAALWGAAVLAGERAGPVLAGQA